MTSFKVRAPAAPISSSKDDRAASPSPAAIEAVAKAKGDTAAGPGIAEQLQAPDMAASKQALSANGKAPDRPSFAEEVPWPTVQAPTKPFTFRK